MKTTLICILCAVCYTCADLPSSPPQIAGVKVDGYIEGDPLALSCSVTVGQPPVTSVTFWCGGLEDSPDTTSTVQGVTTLTSNVTVDRLDLNMNGTVCRCSANEGSSLCTQTATATIIVIAKSSAATTTTPVGSTQTVRTTPASSDGKDNGRQQQSVADSNNDNKDDATPVAAIAGGAAGGLVLVVIIVVVIIIVMRRRKGTPGCARKEGTNDEDFEEHVKHQSSDRIKLTQPKPSSVALCIPANQSVSSSPNTTCYNTEEETALGSDPLSPTAPQPDALNGHSHSHDLDADMYSSADGVDESLTITTPPGSQPQGGDVYSFVSKPKPPKKPEPQKDEYAVVDKTRSKQTGRRSQPKTDGNDASPDVYSQVNKGVRRDNSNPSRPSQPEAEGETCAQVQKPKPAAKPVPATKPKPATAAKPAILPKSGQKDTTYDVPPSRKRRQPVVADYEDVESSNEVTRPTEADDEYNTLNFRENTAAEPPCDPESQYSHIGAV